MSEYLKALVLQHEKVAISCQDLTLLEPVCDVIANYIKGESKSVVSTWNRYLQSRYLEVMCCRITRLDKRLDGIVFKHGQFAPQKFYEQKGFFIVSALDVLNQRQVNIEDIMSLYD